MGHYDLLLQVNERLLNKAFSALFYTGKLKVNGTYELVQNIPERMQNFTKADYKVRLSNEPYIDFLKQDSVGIRMAVELELIIFSGIHIEFDVEFAVAGKLMLDSTSGKLIYDLHQAEISNIIFNDKAKLNSETIEGLNKIVTWILKQYVTEDLKEIEMPLSVAELAIPVTETAKLPFNVAAASIVDNSCFAVGVNFFDHNEDGLETLKNAPKDNDLYVALKKDTALQIAELWWENTTAEKERSFNGTLPINAVRVLSKTSDTLKRLITLGFLQPESEISQAELVYNGTVNLVDLPEISFESNRITVKNLQVKVDLHTTINAVGTRKNYIDSSGFFPDKFTPWEDDVLKNETPINEVLLDMDNPLDFLIKEAECRLSINAKGELCLKVLDADFDLDLGEKWYQNLSEKGVNFVLNFLENKIIDKIPEISIAPSLLLDNVGILNYTFNLKIGHLALSDNLIEVGCDLFVNQLDRGQVPFPLYIANTRSRKVHRFSCETIEDMDFAKRVGYYGIYEAINDGFEPCHECLKGYEFKLIEEEGAMKK